MAKKIIIPVQQAIRPIWTPKPGAPKFAQITAHETIQYEVEMDFDALHAMARRAADNKVQTSKAGPITVRVLQKRTDPVKEQ